MIKSEHNVPETIQVMLVFSHYIL